MSIEINKNKEQKGLKAIKIIFTVLMGLLITPAFAQTDVSASPTLNWKDTIESRGYQLLSGFDTITRKPLRVVAWYMKNNKFGLINHQGIVITKPLYDEFPDIENEYGSSLIYPPRPFLRVILDDMYGLIDYEGNEILQTKYSYIHRYIEEVGLANDSISNKNTYRESNFFFEVDSGNVQFKIDFTGRIFDRIIIETDDEEDEFGYGEMRGSFGIGDLVREPDSDSYPVTTSRTYGPRTEAFIKLEKQFEGNEVFNKTTRKYGLVNKATGDTLIPIMFDRLSLDRFGRIIATKNLIEIDAKTKRSIYKGTMMAMYSMKGKVLFRLKYKEISLFNGIYLLNKDGKIAIYDSLLKPISKHIYDEKMGSSNARVMSLAIDGKYALFNLNGKPYTAFEYDKIAIPNERDLPFPMIIASKNGKDAIMDYTGKLYTGFEYDLIIAECHVYSERGIKVASNFHSNQPNAYFYVKQNNLWGIMDTNYQLILPCVYEDIGKCFDREIILIRQNNLWGIMELTTQKIIYPIELNRKPEQKRQFFVVYNGKFYGVTRKDGTLVHDFTLTTNPSISKVYKGLIKIENYSYTYNSNYIAYIDDYGNVVAYTELRKKR